MRQMKKQVAILAVLLLLFLGAAVPVTAAAKYDCAAGRHEDVVIKKVPPTATKNGYEVIRCKLCGRQYTVILYVPSHLWGPWIVDRPATCTKEGREHRVSTHGTPNTESRTIPALGHHYQLTAVTEPTCTKAGSKTYVCARCGHRYTKSIPALGHTYGPWIVETPAKEGVPGKEARVCSQCGAREERAIPALPAVKPISAPAPKKAPLFNAVDAAAAGTDIALIVLSSLILIPCIRTVSRERRDYQAYKKRLQLEEEEAQDHDFH